MNKKKPFIVQLFCNPSLMWKAGASIVFIVLGAVFIVSPKMLLGDADNMTRFGFGGMVLVYGIFRLYMFVSEYKSMNQDE